VLSSIKRRIHDCRAESCLYLVAILLLARLIRYRFMNRRDLFVGLAFWRIARKKGHTMSLELETALASMPVLPALRGITPEEVDIVAETLLGYGITALEVPIRTKNAAVSGIDADAIKSLERLKKYVGNRAHVAAGTVMQLDDLIVLRKIGVTSCLSISLNPAVVAEATRMGMAFFPAIETVSEATAAISAGARGLKIFPAAFREPDGTITERHTPGYIRYLSKFFTCPIVVSGELMIPGLPAKYLAAGATAINLAGQLYEPKIDRKELAARTSAIISATRTN
jgi:2-dehydro-3-deoxyphosphogalactonate aldolase